MRRGLFRPGIAALTLVLLIGSVYLGHEQAHGAAKAKNVIVLIADGCSSEQYTFARWFKGEALSLDGIRVGAIKTYVADSVVADSAAAASAFATGIRTSDRFISVGPHEKTIAGVPVPPPDLRYRPLATVLEGARLMKKATGIVATSSVTHATPAAYVAHVPSREKEEDIMEQLVHQNVDVVFGGGKELLLPREDKGKRSDGEDLLGLLKRLGYQVVETRDEMVKIDSGKVFGMFALSHMEAEIDRPSLRPNQPTLKEMTEQAIRILSRDPDGFFLMVEGSQIDWACHANDPAHLLSDLLAFDEAVKGALDFARRDRNTMVLALSDHNTGGFCIGNNDKSGSYPQMKVEALLDPFRRMKQSAQVLWRQVGEERRAEKVKEAVKEGWGMEINDEEAARILSLAEKYKHAPHYGLGEVLCPRYTVVGWATHGHCGGDVPLHAYGPGRPQGFFDGPEIGKVCAKALGFDLVRLNERLFVEPDKAIPGATVTMDKTDAANPVVVIGFKGKRVELPVNKNLLKIGNWMWPLEGIVVYAPETQKIYIPLQAVRIITGTAKPLPAITR